MQKTVTLVVPEPLITPATLVFTFDCSPRVWDTYTPTVWKVSHITPAVGSIPLQYSAKLGFAMALINQDVVTFTQASTKIGFRQTTRLVWHGNRLEFTDPVLVDRLAENQIEAVNSTFDFAYIGMGLMSGESLRPIFVVPERLRDGEKFRVEFRPILRVYDIAGYVKDELLSESALEKEPLWTLPFDKVQDGKKFYLKEGPQSRLIVTEDP